MNNGKHPILGYLKKRGHKFNDYYLHIVMGRFFNPSFLNKNITLDSLAPQNTNFFYARVGEV